MKRKISLKEAREQGKLDKFIKEHEQDAPGDAEKMDKILHSAAKPDKVKGSKPQDK